MLIDSLSQTEDSPMKEPSSTVIVLSVRVKRRILAMFLGWLCVVLGAALAVVAAAVTLISAR